ncbi:M16 family metallopeptidase [Myroides sp. LJL119]
MIKRLTLVCMLFVFTSGLHAQYRTLKKTDSLGFEYEVVENDPSKARVYTLKNGLKVYLAQNKDKPLIQTYIPVRAGSNSDPSDNTGLAHYLEHMLFKGTSKLGTTNWQVEQEYLKQIEDLYEQHKAESDPKLKSQIYKQIDSLSKVASQYAVANEYDKSVASIGAVGTNAHTWFEETVYQNTIPSNELDKFLFIESERFSELVLRLFHTELEAVYEEFNRSQDNERRASMQAILEMLFPESNYGQQTTIGTSEHLKNPSMIAIKNYFDKYYVANNMAVVLVGDLEFEPTIELVDKYFGSFKTSNNIKEYVAQEKPLTKIQSKEIFSPEAERVEFAYRLGGVNSSDALYVTLIDMLLSNGQAGLIDLDINQKQAALYAASQYMTLKDYTVHFFFGMPNQGQSIEQVQELLMQELQKIKDGDFDSWLLTAVLNDLRVNAMKALESNSQLGEQMYTAFIQGRTWQDMISDIDKMSKITKEQIMEFAKENYKDNYAVVYKRMGEKKNLVHVENPGITPIDLNRESESEFYKELQQIKVKPIEPVFIDFNAAIKTQKVGPNQSNLYSIENTTNDLGTVTYIFELGSDNDKKLGLAMEYIDYIGTSKYSAADIRKEFYKLGIDYSISVGSDQTFISLSGLNENMEKGIALLEHVFNNVEPDDLAYNNMVEQIIKSRSDRKLNKNAIASALNAYTVSAGEKSRFTDVLSEQQYKEITPQELIDLVKSFFNYNQAVFYYGNDLKRVKDAIVKHHNLGKSKAVPSPTIYPEPQSSKQVFFVPYDMVQAEINFRSREQLFDKNLLASSGVFNSYFGGGMASVVFQEIRESKSLAYSAYAGYINASKLGRYNYVTAYVGTQANKLSQAVDAMMELMTNMPQAQNQFENAKNSTLKNIATLRYTKAQIFYYWLNLQKRGIDYDINKEIYIQTQSMQMSELIEFFNKHVKGKTYNVGLLGKKENLDWQSVQKMGQVKEVTLEEIFGY